MSTERSHGGVSNRSAAPGLVRGPQIDRLTFARYSLYEGGILGPRNVVPIYNSETYLGLPFTSDFTAPTTLIGAQSFQLLPAWPLPLPVRIRNVTAVATLKGLVPVGQAGVTCRDVFAAEVVDLRFSGSANNAGRGVFSNVQAPPDSDLPDVEMVMRFHVKNSGGFVAGNIVHIGWCNGEQATFEGNFSFAGFKLTAGTGFRADIAIVHRDSGAVTTIPTGQFVAPNLNTGIYTVLEVRVSGYFTRNEVTFVLNGIPIRTVRLPLFVSGFFTPTMYLTAGAGLLSNFVLGRIEIGPRELMSR